MKNPLKIVINFLASLSIMTLGSIQAAQAKEVWLNFSVPDADLVLTSPDVKTTPKAAPKPSNFQPSLNTKYSVVNEPRPPTSPQPSVNTSENTTKRIALDFNVPNAEPAPITGEPSSNPESNNLKQKTPPAYKPSSKLPVASKPLTRSQQVTALRRAIIGQESTGRFWLVNPDSGALGYGQLLRENVAPWTKAALGKALTPEEFLSNPQAQIKTIDHKLNQYLKRELAYTDGKNVNKALGVSAEELAIRRVASAWYSGNPNLWNDTRPQYSNGRRYPSITSYTRSVWKRYLREIG